MKTISNLAKANNHKNPTRSTLIRIAVVLSSLLLTAVFMFGYSMVTYQKQSAKDWYGTYYGVYSNLSEDQIKELNKMAEIERTGKMSQAGILEGETDTSVAWMGEDVISMTNFKNKLLSGNFPKAQNEIVMQVELLNKLGYKDAKPGDKIEVSYRKNKKETFQKKVFQLSGILKPIDTTLENIDYVSYVSYEFYTENYAKEERFYHTYFSMDPNLKLTSDTAEELAKEIAQRCGIDPKRVSMNHYYLFWTLEPDMSVVVGCIVVALFIILISILVVYNIFQVGIQWKIQEYGKIKALGATRNQMKQLILKEGMRLSLPVIPIGMILGIVFNQLFMKWSLKVLGEFNGASQKIPFSISVIFILILCYLISALTVGIALLKPMKLVAEVSPIEAMRYQKKDSNLKGVRTGFKEMSVSKMIRANMNVNKKHSIGMVIMLGLSCTFFVILASLLQSMSPGDEARRWLPYGDFEIALNYSMNEEVYVENNLDHILQDNPMNHNFIQQIESLDGVKKVKTQKLLCVKDETGVLQSVAIIDEDYLNKEIENRSNYGNLDYNEAAEKDFILNGSGQFYKEYGYNLGDNLGMQIVGTSEEKLLKGKLAGAVMSKTDWMITKETYEKLNLDKNMENVGRLWIYIEKGKEQKVKNEISRLITGNKQLELTSLSALIEQNEKQIQFMGILGYGLLFFIGVITFLNLANSSLMNMITKKRELGVMQAVGMTNRQLARMLQAESIMISVGSLLISLLVGLPVSYICFLYAREKGIFGLFQYHLPVVAVTALVICILVFQCSLSYIISKNMKKESIIERIRYQE